MKLTVSTDTFFYKNDILCANETLTLFTGESVLDLEFTVGNIPVQFKINIVGEAIQAANTGNNAKTAF